MLRSFVALSALKPLGDELSDLGDLDLSDPIHSLGTLADYAISRVRRTVSPASVTLAHPQLDALAKPITEQVARLRIEGERLLRRYVRDICYQGMAHGRLCSALSDVFAQIASSRE